MKAMPWHSIENSPQTRRKAYIFMLCLAFSFMSWLIIKLSRESAAIIPVSIELVNIPSELIVTGQSDSTFIINAQSTGVKLLSSRFLRRVSRIDSDFNTLQQIRRDGIQMYYMTSSQAEIRFSLLSDIPRSALTVHPDTIFFHTIKAFSKKVPVRFVKDLELQTGFKIYDIPALTPDSIVVSGPLNMADSVSFVRTSPLRTKGVYQDIARTISLENPWKNRQVTFSQNEVEVFLSVEEFTEATVDLAVEIDCSASSDINAEDLMLFPDRVNVYYLVALKDVNAITADMFSVRVNCPDTLSPGRFRLEVEIRESPSLVDIIRIRPAEVEYILIKR
ncbi:MAG: hypothetical protein K0B37_03600 [Bacteroidales bacterium]|nr:hypothetical protein [Bacteroidales bacterium]